VVREKFTILLSALLLMQSGGTRAAETIAACEQLEMVLPDSASRELGQRLAVRGCRAVLRLEKLFAIDISQPIRVSVCRDMTEWRRRSGRPWFVVAVLLDDGLLLQPPRSLGRVDAGQALEHELVHWFIRRRARAPLPRWLEEGLAQKLARQEMPPGAGTTALPARREQLPGLEQRLLDGHDSQAKMAVDYSTCLRLVDLLVRRVGLARLIEALPRLAVNGDIWQVTIAGVRLERLLFDR